VWELGHCLRDVALRAVGQKVAELGGACMGTLHFLHNFARHFSHAESSFETINIFDCMENKSTMLCSANNAPWISTKLPVLPFVTLRTDHQGSSLLSSQVRP
jgi:hypothetical protein